MPVTELGSTDDLQRPARSGSSDDRAWWAEPDPVEIFASGLELALRQLRVEVAGLRAERDGLRLEVEGLRAKLELAQQELGSRTTVSETVRQLQTVVTRLTLLRPDIVPTPAPAAEIDAAVAPLPAAEPPAPPAGLTPEPTAGSALAELRAMGLWPPPRRDEPVAPSPEPVWTPAEVASSGAQPEPTGGSWLDAIPDTPPRPAISWDPELTRDGPSIAPATEDVVAPVGDGAAVASRWPGWLPAVATAAGAAIVLAVLLVAVGPRLLPYQTFFVRSASMAPAIDTGALVVLREARAEDLAVGDVITFEQPGDPDTLVTHRIVGIDGDGATRALRTKGDANVSEDGWRLLASGVRWRYAFDVPYVGYVFGVLGSTAARLLLLVVPLAFAVLALRRRPRQLVGRT